MSTPHDVPATPAPSPEWRRPNPFADVPARDYATDAVALVLLCVSLGLAWSFHDRAWQRVDVVLVSAVSVASLAVTYVVRARRGSLRTALRVRTWLGLPYAVCVLASAAVDAVGAFTLRITGPTLPGGLGPAVAVGLAGAALAAAPRAAESADPALAAAAGRLARSMLGGLLAGVLVLQVLALAAIGSAIVRFADSVSGDVWVGVTADVGLVLLVAALAGGPLLATLRGSAPWRWVLVAIAATTAALALTDGFPVATMLPNGSGGPGLVLAPAAGAVALGAAVTATLRRTEPPVRAWCEVARAAWVAIAVAAGALVVIHLLGLIHLLGTLQQHGLHPGSVTGRMTLIVALDAVIVVLALAATVAVGRRGLEARTAGLWLTAAVVVVGTVVIATRGWSHPGLTDTIVAYGLPLVAVLALTVPDAVRVSARLPGGHGFTAAQAADPATDLAILAAIAERAPELRPFVAANPSAYPDLLAWLAQLHDPAVDAALAARGS